MEAGPVEPETEAAAAAEEREESVGRSHKSFPGRHLNSLGFPRLAGTRIRPPEDGPGPLGALPAFRFPLIPKPRFLALIGVRLGVGWDKRGMSLEKSDPSLCFFPPSLPGSVARFCTRRRPRTAGRSGLFSGGGTFPDRGHVGAGGGFAVGAAVDFLESGEGLFEGGRIEAGLLMLKNPRDEPLVEHMRGHRGFELGIADKEDDGKESVAGQVEAIGERAEVEIVLMKRVLEAVLLPGDLLGPPGLLLRSEDRAPVVLGFDDEDPESGHNDVVKLGAPLSVRPGEVEVVEGAVGGRVKARQTSCDGAFSEPAFEPGGPEDFSDDEDRDEPREPGPVGDEGFDCF